MNELTTTELPDWLSEVDPYILNHILEPNITSFIPAYYTELKDFHGLLDFVVAYREYLVSCNDITSREKAVYIQYTYELELHALFKLGYFHKYIERYDELVHANEIKLCDFFYNKALQYQQDAFKGKLHHTNHAPLIPSVREEKLQYLHRLFINFCNSIYNKKAL